MIATDGRGMNRTQKAIVIIGALLIALTTAHAPYEYHGYNEIARLVNGDGTSESAKYSGTGVVYSPAWAPPERKDVENALVMARDTATSGAGWLTIDDVHLATGRLGLWWAGIALAVAAGVLLTANPATPPE